MIIKNKDIDRQIRTSGRIIRTISPLDKKSFQLFASPLSTKVLSLLRLKNLNCEKIMLKRSDGSEFRLCIFKSNVTDGKRCGILWLHGGGYVLGAPEMVGMSFAKELIKNTNCVLIAPDYALSAKSPYPCGLEDAYLALKWLDENRTQLDIETEKLVVGGESAGGGLTVALCIFARDNGFNKIGIQLPLYPMLDDRPTDSSRNNDAPVWNTKANKTAWQIYLGDKFLNEYVSPYAVPAREHDYTDLPAAVSFVGTIEPFYSETVTYFNNLTKFGVENELITVNGAYHAFDMMNPNALITKQTYDVMLKKYKQFSVSCL